MRKYNRNCIEGKVPNPCAKAPTCKSKPTNITLRTVLLPASMGTDAEGQPYAPQLGAYYNTVVEYQSNGAVYVYDSLGNYTLVEPGNYEELVEKVEGFATAINELYNPASIGYMVMTNAELEGLAPNVVPADQYVLVTEDEIHNNRPWLYEYSPSAGAFIPAMAASPYYEKPFIDSAIAALQTNINNVMNKEMQDVDNLQTNINAEVNAREAAVTELQEKDTELSQRIDDIVNSPDVRYIVDTYADLEAINKSTVGDLDYARVLQDETHDDASTYYQFQKASEEWTYVGQTGPYYTKGQVDEKFTEVDNMIGDVESLLTKLDTGEGI